MRLAARQLVDPAGEDVDDDLDHLLTVDALSRLPGLEEAPGRRRTCARGNDAFSAAGMRRAQVRRTSNSSCSLGSANKLASFAARPSSSVRAWTSRRRRSASLPASRAWRRSCSRDRSSRSTRARTDLQLSEERIALGLQGGDLAWSAGSSAGAVDVSTGDGARAGHCGLSRVVQRAPGRRRPGVVSQGAAGQERGRQRLGIRLDVDEGEAPPLAVRLPHLHDRRDDRLADGHERRQWDPGGGAGVLGLDEDAGTRDELDVAAARVEPRHPGENRGARLVGDEELVSRDQRVANIEASMDRVEVDPRPACPSRRAGQPRRRRRSAPARW